MNRSYKIAVAILVFLVALLTYLEAIEPKPVNWNPSYSAADKIPLGAFVLYDLLKDNFEETVKVTLPPFEFLTARDPKGTYIFINSQLEFDDAELKKILGWVEQGNTMFLASDAFSKNLLDTLNLNVRTLFPEEGLSSKPMLNLVQAEFKRDSAYFFDKETYHSVFTELDTLKHRVLGVSSLFSKELQIKEPEVNFLNLAHGKGNILLHSAPQAFSNFFLLNNNNAEYVEKALAYLPGDGSLYWDEYKKAGKAFRTSPLYILLDNKPLKWAYYFTLIGALLFVLFEGKRKQRAVPVVEPLQNQTYHFTRTIAGMYLDRRDYKKIAVKKIRLFLEYLRLNLRISTSEINEEFYQQVATLSEKEVTEVKQLFHLINSLEAKKTIKKEELLALSSAIDSIKNK